MQALLYCTLVFLISEEEFKVQTKVVEIDFASNETIYDGISDALKDLEIGVLGKTLEVMHDLITTSRSLQ